MSVLERKLATLGRVLRTSGVRGVAAVVSARTAPVRTGALAAGVAVRVRLRHGRPRAVLSFGGGIGDDVVCTILLRALRERGFGPVWMLSNYPDLFEHNDDVAAVLPSTQAYRTAIERLGWPLLRTRYFRYDPVEDRAVRLAPEQHMATTMCQLAGIVGPIVRRPYLRLLDAERAAGALVPRQVAIQSSGMVAGTPMLNKQWYADRFQAVVTALRTEFDFVQVGAPSDPLLEGVLDLRGRTSRRHTAAILSRSLAFVGNVGLLMHVARAVECRSVIVYGGRERPDQSGYVCNENLYTEMACAPCWRRNACEHDRRCMHEIGPDAVVAALRRVVARHGTPLEVDTDVVMPPAPLEPATSRAGLPMVAITLPTGRVRRIEAKVLAAPSAADGRPASPATRG